MVSLKTIFRSPVRRQGSWSFRARTSYHSRQSRPRRKTPSWMVVWLSLRRATVQAEALTFWDLTDSSLPGFLPTQYWGYLRTQFQFQAFQLGRLLDFRLLERSPARWLTASSGKALLASSKTSAAMNRALCSCRRLAPYRHLSQVRYCFWLPECLDSHSTEGDICRTS